MLAAVSTRWIEIHIVCYPGGGGVCVWKLRGTVTVYVLFPGSNHGEIVALFKRSDKRVIRRKGGGGCGGGGRMRIDDW